MGQRAWQRHLGEVARRTRWQGERRRCRPDSPIARLNRLRGIDLRRTEQNSLWHGEELVRELRKASLESVTAAAASAKSMPADFRVSITNAPGKDAYPISSFTWLLIPEKSKDPNKGKILADFLNWMVDDGQKMTAELTYAPLPDTVATKVKAAIKQV